MSRFLGLYPRLGLCAPLVLGKGRTANRRRWTRMGPLRRLVAVEYCAPPSKVGAGAFLLDQGFHGGWKSCTESVKKFPALVLGKPQHPGG